MNGSSIHASALLIAARGFGAKAVLIRGPSGAGKSRLAFALIEAGRQGTLLFARLVADDRALLEPQAGRLLVRPADSLKGLLEVRGLELRRLPFEPAAVAGLVVDLAAPDAARLPEPAARTITLEGVFLPRLAIAAGHDPLPMVLAFLHSAGSGI
jgi:hypothetical protein